MDDVRKGLYFFLLLFKAVIINLVQMFVYVHAELFAYTHKHTQTEAAKRRVILMASAVDSPLCRVNCNCENE